MSSLKWRRRADIALLATAAILVGVAVTWGAATETERVTGLWAGAEISGDGSARITEIVDYSFGGESRHGIFRDVPGLSPEAVVTASSATAPDQVELIDLGAQTRIRIGDPIRTVEGRHRYQIQYPLASLAPNGKVAWDAVGNGWPVDLRRIEIHLVAPFEFAETNCVQGPAGSRQPCQITQPEPGHLVVRIDELGAGNGATLYASAGRVTDAPRLPIPQSDPVADARLNPLLPGLLAAFVTLIIAALVSWSVRRAGRERVATGGLATAAWGATGVETRLDAEKLAASIPMSGPPANLTPAQGGVLLTESVKDRHKVAWLLSAAVDGYLDIETDGPKPILVRRSAVPPAPRTQALLDQIFAGRDRVPLGSYDPNIEAAWKALGAELEFWRQTCQLWDPAGDRRCRRARWCGAIATPLGLIVAVAGGIAANRTFPGWPGLVAIGAAGVGAGLALLIRSWELRVRAPAGSELLAQVESFRRFLAASGPHHADEAAEGERLGLYTAWAVALGETNRWSTAIAASTKTPSNSAPMYVYRPSVVSSAMSASSTPPSASSSGSGSGGSVGGGGGGGGGGSW